MANTGKVINAMIEYFGTDVRRINHFLKVFAFAKAIGEGENLESKEQELLEVAAIVHDIGIKISEQKYNSSAGKYQELEGPAEAENLLKQLGYDMSFIDDVKYLVAHHHTYNCINTVPYQILVEADFIVNLFEDDSDSESIKSVYDKIFKTQTGKMIMQKMYLDRGGI
ncbi:MAG: HD domain-containing protein [Ruminococcus sp.]|nr:HD domain-containing protein [Ruminococcus sp.]